MDDNDTDTLTVEDCLDFDPAEPQECGGAVEFRMPLSPSGRAFPRCDTHWSKRLDKEEALSEVYGSFESDVPPQGFREDDIGERWEED